MSPKPKIEPQGRARHSVRAVPYIGKPRRARSDAPYLSAPLDRRHAFTLIEIMAVVAIMAIVLTMSIPSIYRAMHKEGLRKAEWQILEVFTEARRQAIMQGSPVDVVFHPRDGHFEVAGGAA